MLLLYALLLSATSINALERRNGVRHRSIQSKDRLIYVVRHGERVDNVDKTWKSARIAKGEIWDNPSLTVRGLRQASETGVRLSSLDISAAFVSPFTRTIQTATQILKHFKSPPPLYIEYGFTESLGVCMDPPGIPSKEEMRKISPYLNFNYTPIYSLPLPKETGGDTSCYQRVSHSIDLLVKKTTGNILIVSHGSPISSINLHLLNRWTYVGQCTVSTIAIRNGSYVPISLGDSSHLSDRTNLNDDLGKEGTKNFKELEKKVIEERKQNEAKKGKENV